MNLDNYDDCKKFEKAISQDDTRRVAELIAAGAHVNHEYFFGYPVSLAAQFDCIEVIRELSKSGANLNIVGFRKNTPLITAIYSKHLVAIKVLLKLGADPNRRDDTPLQSAPLHIALWRKRSTEAAKILIQYGADIFAKAWTDNTAIDYAIFFECTDIVDLFLGERDPKVKAAITRAQKNLFLIRNAEANELGGVKNALASGANVNAIDPNATFALRHAAEHGNNAMVKLLLDNKAKVALCADLDKKTALLEAAYHGHRETVDLLLNAGANLLEEYIPAEYFSGGPNMDAIACAREGGHMDLCEYLKELRTDLKLQRRKKRSRK